MEGFWAYDSGRSDLLLSELLRSEIEDINLHNRVVHIRERKRVRGVKSTRTVPLSAQLQKFLPPG